MCRLFVLCMEYMTHYNYVHNYMYNWHTTAMHLYISSSIVLAGHSTCRNHTTIQSLCYCVWQWTGLQSCDLVWREELFIWCNIRDHTVVVGWVHNIYARPIKFFWRGFASTVYVLVFCALTHDWMNISIIMGWMTTQAHILLPFINPKSVSGQAQSIWQGMSRQL